MVAPNSLSSGPGSGKAPLVVPLERRGAQKLEGAPLVNSLSPDLELVGSPHGLATSSRQ